MKRIVGIGLFAIFTALTGCQSGQESCARGDWCACSNGTDCYQGCAGDGDGCRFFCTNMVRCGAVCGKDCNIESDHATDTSSDCGDACNISCSDSTSCGAFCGANCNYSCWNMQHCGVQVGPGSLVTCSSAKNCVVKCLGACHVFCTDEVDRCEVSCPDGASPISCTDGSVACGSCP